MRRGFRPLVGALVLILLLLCGCGRGDSAPSSATIAAVFDGDTVALDTGERVRYLGIDAPEVAHGKGRPDCYGDEASRVNREWVLHRRVTLQYDREKKDRYGRLLAYIFLPDGRCVNGELVKGGYAYVDRSHEGFGRESEFVSYQREAVRAGRGLWSACPVKPSPYYVGNAGTFILHRPRCPLGKETSARHRVRFTSRLQAFEEGFRPCRWCKP